MNLIIHRGTKEIGGTCAELQTENSRILIDFGLPLVDENKDQFDFKGIRDKSEEGLIEIGLLPKIDGLYESDTPKFDGVLLSHPHPDHFGLLPYVNSKIPVFTSRGCKELLDVSSFFNQTVCNLENIRIIKPWEEFQLGGFSVMPYLVDHSGFDALAFLIEADGKRLFYSGDFRGHGRKSVLFDNILKDPPDKIDYLLLEGTALESEEGQFETEEDVENELVNILGEGDSQFFFACSSQNIDRLVSGYKACVRTNSTLVIDPYTAFVLDKLKAVSSNIPQYDWGNNIKIYFAPNSYTKKMGEQNELYRFKSAKITFQEMVQSKGKFLIKDSYAVRKTFANKNEMGNTKLIYSMWSGYLPDVKPFWEKENVPIIEVHTSGHAFVGELQKFVKAINPSRIVPIHTFYPEKYKDYFDYEILNVIDGQVSEL